MEFYVWIRNIKSNVTKQNWIAVWFTNIEKKKKKMEKSVKESMWMWICMVCVCVWLPVQGFSKYPVPIGWWALNYFVSGKVLNLNEIKLCIQSACETLNAVSLKLSVYFICSMFDSVFLILASFKIQILTHTHTPRTIFYHHFLFSSSSSSSSTWTWTNVDLILYSKLYIRDIVMENVDLKHIKYTRRHTHTHQAFQFHFGPFLAIDREWPEPKEISFFFFCQTFFFRKHCSVAIECWWI